MDVHVKTIAVDLFVTHERLADDRPVQEYEAALRRKWAALDEVQYGPCFHIESGSPCDWDVCNQPERLAAGDRGPDPLWPFRRRAAA